MRGSIVENYIHQLQRYTEKEPCPHLQMAQESIAKLLSIRDSYQDILAHLEALLIQLSGKTYSPTLLGVPLPFCNTALPTNDPLIPMISQWVATLKGLGKAREEALLKIATTRQDLPPITIPLINLMQTLLEDERCLLHGSTPSFLGHLLHEDWFKLCQYIGELPPAPIPIAQSPGSMFAIVFEQDDLNCLPLLAAVAQSISTQVNSELVTDNANSLIQAVLIVYKQRNEPFDDTLYKSQEWGCTIY